MAVFGLFSKRDKHKLPQDAGSKASIDASASDSHSVDTDLASTSGQRSPRSGNNVYSGPAGASSSKLMLGFGGKKSKPSHQTDGNGYLRPPPSVLPKNRFASSKSESGHEFLGPPPSRSGLFASYDGTDLARSTRSLPATTASEPGSSRLDLDNASRTSSTPNVKKAKGMFAWAHRERKKSKPPPPPDVLPASPDESFNLKSFRHVRPVSPGPTTDLPPRPPSSLSTSGLTPPVRPRGNSTASVDSSQRISVAAFREMAARRSAANSPSPSSADLRGDGSSYLRPPSTFTQGIASPSPPPPSFRRTKAASPTSDSTSSESESEEDEESAGSSTLRPKRRGPTDTITPHSAGKSSELGQLSKSVTPRMRASPSGQSNASDRASLYSRTRASQSTSALTPNVAAQRASAKLAAQNTANGAAMTRKMPAKVVDSDSDSTSSDSDSDSDSDDAPLANRVLGHRRTGSGTSTATAGTNVSRARMLPKPLIDISGLSPPSLPPLETDKTPLPRPASLEPKEKEAEKDQEGDKENIKIPEAQDTPKEPEKETASSSPANAKPTLNDRLARLAASVSTGRSNTIANPDEAEKANAERGRSPGPLAQPKRSQTLPVETLALEPPPTSVLPMPTPSPTKTKPNGRSYSYSNAYDGVKDLSDLKPIVPTPIRERSPPPAFSVTSRPTSQMSLASHVHFGAARSEQSPTGKSISPPLTTAQARAMAARTPSPATITSQPQTQSPTELRSPIDSRPRPESRPRSDSRTNSSPALHHQLLIPDHGMQPSKGFTGGGLLASAAESGRASPASASSNSTAPSRVRRRSQTMEQLPTLQSIPEPTVAPKPVRPRPFVNVSTSSESSQTSASTSESAPSPRAAVAPTVTPAQQRARARTMEGPRDTAGSVNGIALMNLPPVKPFAGGVRGYSPASSTGESSSGRTPITPQDGSEVSFAVRDRARAKERLEGAGPGTSVVAARGHRKRSSLTFAEVEGLRCRPALAERDREEKAKEESVEDVSVAENRRKQRRRSEAMAALELGRIVNGRPPTDDDDDEDRPLDNMPPRMSMMNNMMGVSPSGPMNMNMNMMSSPTPWSNPQPGMISSQQFMMPPVPPNADATFLAAHQQAMMFAKQAYQMAVAQQAMAAAEEEWERGSNAATSMLNGGGGRASAFGVGPSPMTPMTPMGYGMGMPGMSPMNMGMNMNMPWPGMMGGFPSSAQSMYAGSVAGSELGTGARGQGWGSRSAYGDPSAGERTSMFRGSTFGMQPPSMPPRAVSSGIVQTVPQRPGPRPRTRTGPSAPSGGARREQVPPLPPTSWKSGARPT
ncbi:hypothetical protein DAEQUDRAFT_770024 [Daedalea quercina L-15889]|uniref:Uncharacterized protein n=1 Tax=Daedalea quercina L-15889 TaxID=1314783 RepID=A0A165L7W7_9APHY|nr:hypothetical protein DAEQUDRAFT_770024 [Daedalea quercina L-15889]